MTQHDDHSNADQGQSWNAECETENPLNLTGRGKSRIATVQERRCPFTQNPFADCYVARLRSLDIVKAIYYCGGEYEECEIYRKRSNDAKDEYPDKDEDRLSCQSQYTGKPHERKERAGS